MRELADRYRTGVPLEALQNIAQYAGARHAPIDLAERDGTLLLAVSDDGAGFDGTVVTRGASLQNMADRIEALGGSLQVDSAPGAGTRVEAAIPLPAQARA